MNHVEHDVISKDILRLIILDIVQEYVSMIFLYNNRMCITS